LTHQIPDNKGPAQAAQGTGTRRQWLHWAALGAVLAVSLGLRLWHLDDQSIWYDEGWSIHLAQLSPRQALALIASPGHTHPPGYYALLMGWVRIFGDSVFAVRGFSVALGVANVVLLYLLGRDLFGKPTGLIAAALLAVSPAHIVYSQETRMYALLMTCVTALALCYWRLGERQRAIRPAVQWRKICFGSQSQIGEHFTGRLLSVVRTCQLHDANPFLFLTKLVNASFSAKPHLSSGPISLPK